MVVKVKQGKKKGSETTEQTFQLGADTKFEFVTVARHAKGEKPEKTIAPAALSDVKPGERVQISAGDGTHGRKRSASSSTPEGAARRSPTEREALAGRGLQMGRGASAGGNPCLADPTVIGSAL